MPINPDLLHLNCSAEMTQIKIIPKPLCKTTDVLQNKCHARYTIMKQPYKNV